MGLDLGINLVKREEAMYWRKANAIRGWFSKLPDFVDNGNTPISKKNLTDLLEICNTVRESKGTPSEYSVVMNNLPPEDGFFFGSTEIDDWYWEDIDNTIDFLKEWLPKINEYDELEYWEWY